MMQDVCQKNQNIGCQALIPVFPSPGDDAMTGDTDKYLAPHDLRELGDDSLPQEGYMGFSVGARSQRWGSLGNASKGFVCFPVKWGHIHTDTPPKTNFFSSLCRPCPHGHEVFLKLCFYLSFLKNIPVSTAQFVEISSSTRILLKQTLD